MTASNVTMYTWLEWLRKWRTAQAAEWAEEAERDYGASVTSDRPISAEGVRSLEPPHYYLRFGSWTFCGRCGRRRPDGARPERGTTRYAPPARVDCRRCPLTASQLEAVGEEPVGTEQLYATPQRDEWPAYDAVAAAYRVGAGAMMGETLLSLSKEEAQTLAPIKLFCDYRREKGNAITAPFWNIKKLSVVRAEWKDEAVEGQLSTPRARAAYAWLLEHNEAYAHYIKEHASILQSPEALRHIRTSALLLHMPGVEVAVRPVLYARAAFGDSDLKQRLLEKKHCTERQFPSMKHAVLRKALSRCRAYAEDFMMLFLLTDIAKARQLMVVVSVAERKKVTPEVIAGHYPTCESYWRHEQDILCDMCRIMAARAQDPAYPSLYRHPHSLSEQPPLVFPNVFITVAPAGWKFLSHEGVMCGYSGKHKEKIAGALTLRIYQCKTQLLLGLLQENEFFQECYEHVLRIEFQGRGALHVHLALWCKVRLGVTIEGRTGTDHESQLVAHLEDLFGPRALAVDVQLGSGYLNYINGYTAKASDALNFSMKEHRGVENKAAWPRPPYHP